MTAPVRIWLYGACHPAFRCGGWSYVRVAGGEVTGRAGGDRATTATAMTLAALAAAADGLPDVAVELTCTSAYADAVTGVLAIDDDSTAEQRDLHRLHRGLAARRVLFRRLDVRPNSPLAFVAAWADLGMDKAKATGRFSAAIPKPNLAKIEGLPGA